MTQLNHKPVTIYFTAMLLVISICLYSGDVWADETPQVENAALEFTQSTGIEIVSIRPTAADYMLDLRYRVIDYDRAMAMFQQDVSMVLLQPDSKLALHVINTPKAGDLRQKPEKPVPASAPRPTYFVLFANPAKHLKSGQTVSLQFGDYRLDNIGVL